MTLTARFLSVFGDARVIAKGEAAGLELRGEERRPEVLGQGTYEPPIQQAIAANLAPGDAFGASARISVSSASSPRAASGRAVKSMRSNLSLATPPLSQKVRVQVNSTRYGCSPKPRAPHPAVASLLLAHHIGGAALASAGAPPDISGRLEVSIVAIDDAIAQRGLRPPSLVKIDVEGAEIDVLGGMTETLRRQKVIYEVDDATRDGLDRKARKIAELLTAAGYALETAASLLCQWGMAGRTRPGAAGGGRLRTGFAASGRDSMQGEQA